MSRPQFREAARPHHGLQPCGGRDPVEDRWDLKSAVVALRDSGKNVNDTLWQHLSPPGLERSHLTGDSLWRQSKQAEQDRFQLQWILGDASCTIFSVCS
jgi:hypothetical protein